jgi:hypothetical protein
MSTRRASCGTARWRTAGARASGRSTRRSTSAPAGGLYTSIPDLQKWDENFYTGRVGGAAVLQRLQTRGTLNDGKVLAYAWGLQLGEYRGLPIVEHGGSLGGYRAHILRFPSQHTSVALLCNASTIVPATLARRVAELELKDRFTQPAPPIQGSVTGPAASTSWHPTDAAVPGFAGVYYSEEVDATFAVSTKDRELQLERETDAEPAVLQPGAAPDEFRARGLTIRFQRDGAGKVQSLTVDAGRVRGIKFTRR